MKRPFVRPLSTYFFISCLADTEITGDMTNAQNTRATNENLAKIGFSLGLDAYIQLNPSAQGVVPGRLMATTIEAIVGAVYLDSNKDIMVLRCLIVHLRVMPTL
jgi:ribonuclease-3